MTALIVVVQFLSILVIAPAVVGLVRSCKAKFQNRVGASLFVPYWQLFSLFRKEMTITTHSSWVFHVVPFVVLGVALSLALIVPTIAHSVIFGQLGNVFFISALVALGSVFLVLGGMDTASTFGNMGSSREMTIVALVEPAFFVTFSALAVVAGTWSLDGIVAYLAETGFAPAIIVTLVGFVFVILAENARYPVDNPATHLELTMVHEAMVLEYSGPYLALLEYASAIKLTVMLSLLANLIYPMYMLHPTVSDLGIVLAFAMFVIKVALAAFFLAFIESIVVKMRFFRIQEYMSLAFLIAFAGCILLAAFRTI